MAAPVSRVSPGSTPLDLDEARRVADAVLFEGYLLYPYRASATKNQLRWQFGVLAPPDADSGDDHRMETQVLFEAGPDAVLDVVVRFLHLATRQGEGNEGSAGSDGSDGQWDEGEVVEHRCTTTVAALLGGLPLVTELGIEPATHERDGVAFSRQALALAVTVSGEVLPGPYGVGRCAVVVENTTPGANRTAARREVLRVSLVGTHVLLRIRDGHFLSSTDPPEWARPAVATCRNRGAFPVLAAAADDVVLASPFILPDHPQIAPESAGPLFDATEVDEILVLRTLALGDDEKAEARRTDPRAAELIDRVETLPAEVFERLHGAIRSLHRIPAEDEEVALVRGVPVRPGSRVRMWPRSGGDAQDAFWAGRTALVTTVLHDVDGRDHVAVVADDDPGADVREWQGRYLYFDPSELEPLGDTR
jgi:hypothetical protein